MGGAIEGPEWVGGTRDVPEHACGGGERIEVLAHPVKRHQEEVQSENGGFGSQAREEVDGPTGAVAACCCFGKRWAGGWVGGWVEEKEAVRMSYLLCRRSG